MTDRGKNDGLISTALVLDRRSRATVPAAESFNFENIVALPTKISRPKPVDLVDNHNCLETALIGTRSAFMTRKEGPIMTLHFLPPAIDPYEAVVEEAIATCNGDLRGALKALIIANEFLERDLERACVSDGSPSIAHDEYVGFRNVSWGEDAVT